MDNLNNQLNKNKCFQKWETGSSFASFIFGDTFTLSTIQYAKFKYKKTIFNFKIFYKEQNAYILIFISIVNGKVY